MKGVQCYELFGGIALNNHAFSFTTMCTSNASGQIDHRALANDLIQILNVVIKAVVNGERTRTHTQRTKYTYMLGIYVNHIETLTRHTNQYYRHHIHVIIIHNRINHFNCYVS